eukprot:GILJ01001437.1.p1 GENE.GILJ01001437.1~~GILJ01001437.1.p1  ORF type:complete len:398 (-),score=81.00 GILJ01001437.1:260-1393(-)
MRVAASILLTFLALSVAADDWNTFNHPVGNFVFKWRFPTADSIEVQYSLPGAGMAAIGFGSSMTNADMIIANANGDGSWTVGDYYSLKHEVPKTDLSLGGTHDLLESTVTSVQGTTTVTFRRKLVTSDKFDNEIVVGTIGLIYAWADTPLSFHGKNANIVSINLKPAQSSVMSLSTLLASDAKGSFEAPTGGFKLEWSFPSADEIAITYRINGKGWAGLGFGTGMQSADMVIAIANADGTVSVKDYFSSAYKPPQEDTTLGGTNDLLDVSGHLDGAALVVSFRRKLTTGDQFDFPILKETTRVLYAWGDGPFGFHGKDNFNLVNVDLSQVVAPSAVAINLPTAVPADNSKTLMDIKSLLQQQNELLKTLVLMAAKRQ